MEESLEEEEDEEGGAPGDLAAMAAADEDSSDPSDESDPSSSEEDKDDDNNAELPMNISADGNVTFESHDTIDPMLQEIAGEARNIYGAFEDDKEIDFNVPMKRIQDVTESASVLEFRFRKNHVQLVANMLWPRMSLFLETDKDRIMCTNH